MAGVLTVLTLYLAAHEVATAVVDGLKFLTGLKDRAETAFAHAKTRTIRLSEAAIYAQDFIMLFEGTVDELKTVFDGPRRPLLVRPLRKLQQAVRKAELLMRDLERYSAARWFARGNAYRAQITEATERLDAACHDLAQVLTTGGTEVALINHQLIQQLTQQVAKLNDDHNRDAYLTVTPKQIEDQEVKQHETAVGHLLTAEDFRELVGLVNEEHAKFTATVAVVLNRTNSNADAAIHGLEEANDTHQASSLLVTEMRSKLEIHGAVREALTQLQCTAWEELQDAIATGLRVMKAGGDYNNAATRKTRLSFFWGQVNEPLRKFREALRLFEEACKRLAIDKPKLTANVSATLAEVHVIDKDFDEQMEELITGWTSEGEQKTNEATMSKYFTDVLERLWGQLRVVLLVERKQLVVNAHRFLYTTDFDSFVPRQPAVMTSHTHAQEEKKEENAGKSDEEPGTAQLETKSDPGDATKVEEEPDSPDTGKTETEPETLQYPEIEGVSEPDHDKLTQLMQLAQRHADRFFVRTGNRLEFKADEPIEHDHVHALLEAVEMIDVFVKGLQLRSAARLDTEVLQAIKGLANAFTLLPHSITTPGPGLDLDAVQKQLDAIQCATDLLLAKFLPKPNNNQSPKPSATPTPP